MMLPSFEGWKRSPYWPGLLQWSSRRLCQPSHAVPILDCCGLKLLHIKSSHIPHDVILSNSSFTLYLCLPAQEWVNALAFMSAQLFLQFISMCHADSF